MAAARTAAASGPLHLVGVDGFGARLVAAASGALAGAGGCGAEEAESLEAAVRRAAELVVGRPGGATVVFSPGAPTPLDQGSWQDRSRRFAAAVAALEDR